MMIPFTDTVELHWEAWLQVVKQRCHINFQLAGENIQEHINACLNSARTTVQRVVNDIDFIPQKILEVGSSVGFNCIALSAAFPNALISGIEPDEDAVAIGAIMAAAANIKNIQFKVGFIEDLPYDDAQFDLIVCHTVIEHVQDVQKGIAEISRILAPAGIIHLEAPNYIWPYEPHLKIWCLPVLGKCSIRLMATFQGKTKDLAYLDQLQFVTPSILERHFQKNHLIWENRVETKLKTVCKGDTTQIQRYKTLAAILYFLQKLKIGIVISRLIALARFYPSVLYTIRKSRHA